MKLRNSAIKTPHSRKKIPLPGNGSGSGWISLKKGKNEVIFFPTKEREAAGAGGSCEPFIPAMAVRMQRGPRNEGMKRRWVKGVFSEGPRRRRRFRLLSASYAPVPTPASIHPNSPQDPLPVFCCTRRTVNIKLHFSPQDISINVEKAFSHKRLRVRPNPLGFTLQTRFPRGEPLQPSKLLPALPRPEGGLETES